MKNLKRKLSTIEGQLDMNERLEDTELEAVVDLDENDQTFTRYYRVTNGEREEITNQNEIDELMQADDSISVEVQN